MSRVHKPDCKALRHPLLNPEKTCTCDAYPKRAIGIVHLDGCDGDPCMCGKVGAA